MMGARGNEALELCRRCCRRGMGVMESLLRCSGREVRAVFVKPAGSFEPGGGPLSGAGPLRPRCTSAWRPAELRAPHCAFK